MNHNHTHFLIFLGLLPTLLPPLRRRRRGGRGGGDEETSPICVAPILTGAWSNFETQSYLSTHTHKSAQVRIQSWARVIPTSLSLWARVIPTSLSL